MKTLSESSLEYALESAEQFADAVDTAKRITKAHNDYSDAPIEEREAAMLKEQFATLFLPMEAGDELAGRVRYPLVGLSPEPVGLGYYCKFETLEEGAAQYPQYKEAVDELIAYWRGNTTAEKTRKAYPQWIKERLPSDAWTKDSGVAFPLYRMAGSNLDYDKLLSLGIDGLEAELEGTPFYYVPALLRATIDRYVETSDSEVVVHSLKAIRHGKPQTFREAAQLFWLYALHAGTWNYNRLDVALGSFLAADMSNGEITQDEALTIVCSLWRLMHAYSNQYNNRVFIGGKGRRNEADADQFALLAIEATRRVRLNQPQLSMRFYEGQNPQLWERALDAIGEGCTFPMLYNDDVNIPAVAKAFGVDEETATNYTPFGCGEYVLGHYSEGSPNGVINLLKALEVALHAGQDPFTGETVVPNLPNASEYNSFEDVWANYEKVVTYYVEACAVQQKIEYDITAAEAPFSFISALTADCVERKASAFSGGVRYLGGTLETYGNSNAADSLHAIDELVFKQKKYSIEELITALDANFENCESLLAECKAVSKYGNDEGTADAMARRVHEQICSATAAQAGPAGLHSYLVVIINNWANTVLGWKTGASAEGRLSGQPMANGNNPAPGADKSGVTAFLNSLVQLEPSIHAGAVQNMKFTKEWFGQMRPKFDALLKAYFANGGTQAMITVVSRDDLEAAMREPEKWGHLMVRVGGFSIRFVELPKETQLEVLGRTLH